MNKNNYTILFKICIAFFIWVLLFYIHRKVNKKYESLTNIIIDKSEAFCEHHRGSSHILEKSCGKLTQKKCNSTSCCLWTSNDKCVAGTANGPTYNTDTKTGKTNNLDYYYYQNKCYGPKCP